MSAPTVRDVDVPDQWETVFQSLPTPDEGWATAKAVAEVVHLSPSTVTRRLNALEEGGRVESSTDRAVTGARGRVWRQRPDRPSLPVVGGIETVEDVKPDADPVQRYVDAVEGGVFDDIRPGEDVEPDGRACEKCGGPIARDEVIAGYIRCEVCDPDGDHSVHGEAPEMAVDTAAAEMTDDEANEEFDGLPSSLIEGDDPKTDADGATYCRTCGHACAHEPPCRLIDSDKGPVCEDADDCLARLYSPIDEEDGDPSPISPAPTGGDYAAIAEALAPTGDPLSAADARALTDQIRRHVTELLPLIKEAWTRRADLALGYESWAAYCDTELRGLRMPLQERQAATVELRAARMSTRAIAGALGSSDATVRRDLEAATASDDAVATVTGLDGKTRSAHRPAVSVWHCQSCAHTWPIPTTGPNTCPQCGGHGGYEPPATTTDSPAGPAVPSDEAMGSPSEAGFLPAAPGDTPGQLVPGEADTPQPIEAPSTSDTADSPAVPAVASTTPGGDGGDSRLPDRPGPDAPERVRKAGHDDAGPVPPAAQDTTQRLDVPAGGTAHPDPAVAEPARPIVLVASPVSGRPPARAELWEDNGGPTVKVVYCDSRTHARIARRRIVGADVDPAPAAPAAQPDRAEDFGTISAGGRDLHVRGGWHANTDLRLALLAVETDGEEVELVALNALKVELLISRLQAVHRWLVTA